MGKNMNKCTALFFAFILVFIGSPSIQVKAGTNTVYWDKMVMNTGQIGRVTILNTTPLYKLQSNNTLKLSQNLQKGKQYRVYSIKNIDGDVYGLGAGYYIRKNSATVKYEPAPKDKLAQLRGLALSQPYSQIALDAQKIFKNQHYEYKSKLANYNSTGNYFNSTSTVIDPTARKFDENGIIMVNYGGTYRYNPVTIAQYALANYGKYNLTKDISYKEVFLKYADALINMQGSDGALRYNFPFTKDYLHVKYPSGWVSAMAQGQALSVYSRAYFLTQDSKYLTYGQNAFQFMNTPISKGGTLTTLEPLNSSYKKQNYFWYEEYISSPNNYTLNGFMFAMFGLYDWSKVPSSVDMGQKEAGRMFSFTVKSLKAVLPLYDVKGYTSYDLSGLTMHQSTHMVPEYHAIHLYQLYGLYSITKDPTLLNYYTLWSSYVTN